MPLHAVLQSGLVLILCPALVASATTLIEPGQAIGTGVNGGAISTAVGDLDGDGVAEVVTIATLNSNDPHFRIHQFLPSQVWAAVEVRASNDVAARLNRFGGDSHLVDMNGDDYLDILVPESLNGAGRAAVSWFENPADGGIAGPWTEHVIATWDGSSGAERPAHMSEVEAGDLDGDGDTDVVTRDVLNGVYLLENNGAGVFNRHHLPTNPREGLDLFDPDGDGDLDLLLNGVWYEASDPGDGPTQYADLSDIGSYIRHDITPDGVASSPWHPSANTPATRNDYASKVLAVDLNGDGVEDVAITNSEELSEVSADVKPEGLTVYLANGLGGESWTEVVVQSESRKLHTLDAADLDLDGDIDLLTGVSPVGRGTEDAEVFAYLNDGDGLSWTKQAIDDVNIYSGLLVDYDGDGDHDLVGPRNWEDGPLRAFESNAVELATRRGDYVADGTIDQDDYARWQADYGKRDNLLTADGNGDGVIDAADYAVWRDASEAVGSAHQVPETVAVTLALIATLLTSETVALRSR